MKKFIVIFITIIVITALAIYFCDNLKVIEKKIDYASNDQFVYSIDDSHSDKVICNLYNLRSEPLKQVYIYKFNEAGTIYQVDTEYHYKNKFTAKMQYISFKKENIKLKNNVIIFEDCKNYEQYNWLDKKGLINMLESYYTVYKKI